MRNVNNHSFHTLNGNMSPVISGACLILNANQELNFKELWRLSTDTSK
jgi:hypothetical protein